MDEMGHGWTDIAFLSEDQYREELSQRQLRRNPSTSDGRQQR
jgi:hypothetical protein